MPTLTLDKVLKRKRLSKRQFALRLGVPYQSVFRYFREGYDPKLSMMDKWAKAIGCKIGSLYRD